MTKNKNSIIFKPNTLKTNIKISDISKELIADWEFQYIIYQFNTDHEKIEKQILKDTANKK